MNILTNFDTHRFFKHLTAAGLPPPAAEVLMQEFAHLLNMKSDTDSTRLLTDLWQLRTDIYKWKVEVVLWQAATLMMIFALIVGLVIT